MGSFGTKEPSICPNEVRTMIDVYWKGTGITESFIRELQSYCMKNVKIEKVLLFGSRAKGEFNRSSDIDLAVFTTDATHTEQNLIAQEINEMHTPLKIDIVFMNRLKKEKLILNIKKEGALIYEQGQTIREA